jgi:CRP-like cAMP-binding protein
VRGRVRVVNYSVSGREITFDELASGSYFGELAAIDGAPRSANVIAVEDTLILALPRGAFLDAISQHPAVAARVMRRLASIVRSANERIMDLSTLAAQNRVQAELLRQAQGRERRANAAIIAPIPVHSDIASRVSTTRETVARVMNDLARKGIVERRKGALVIHDMRRLESLVEDVRG